MRGNSRLIALLVALGVGAIAVFAAGCGSSSSTTGESSGSEKLTVGSDIPYPPFEQGKPPYTGFDVDLMNAVAENIGREAEFQDTSFDTIFVDLGQHKFEVVASAATITPEREKTVDFSNPYYLAEQAILVKKGGEIDSVAKLKGATVGAQKGTTGAEFVDEKAEAGELRVFPQGPDAVNAVKAGTVEAVVMDIPVAENAAESSDELEVSAAIPTEEEYGFAVAQGETELLEEINEGLKEAIDDGTYAEIYEKWFKHSPPDSITTATHEPT